ncbi:MAG: hypothetical protein ACI924_001715 [Flavobacterium sp.]|jgi:hypothetical protein
MNCELYIDFFCFALTKAERQLLFFYEIVIDIETLLLL